jgi:ferrous iron transport protein A
MNLAAAGIGDTVQISAVGGERSFRRRLMELGLVPGTLVEFVAVAPLGDPLKLLVRGAQLSIRRSEAALIEVQHSTSAATQPVPASMAASRSAS